MRGGLALAIAVAAVAVVLVSDEADATRLYWASNLPGFAISDVGTLVFTNAATVPQQVRVTAAGGGFIDYTVGPGASVQHLMPTPVQTPGLHPAGNLITAEDGIIVAQFNPINNLFTNDAYRLLSLGELGTDHYVPSYAGPASNVWAFLTVVTTQANTQVQITPAGSTMAGGGVTGGAAGATQTYSVPLALTSINLMGNTGQDLTGSHITADAPIAVFSGHSCISIGASACDHVSEQVEPVGKFDTEYPICSSKTFRNGPLWTDRLRIIALEPGPTTVAFNPVTVSPTITLSGVGAWQEVPIRDDVMVSASQNVLVAQYYADSISGGGGAYGDPAMIIHHKIASWKDEQLLYIPAGWDDYLNIAAPATATSDVDGVPVAAWRNIGAGTGFKCATVTVGDGEHSVVSTQNVSVQVLGVQDAASYWYLADVGLEPPPPIPCHLDLFTTSPTPPTVVNVNPLADPMDVRVTWGPPADDGGCPVMGYEVAREDPNGGQTIIATLPPDAPLQVLDRLPTTCEDYKWGVRTWTNHSYSSWAGWPSHGVGNLPGAPPNPTIIRHGDGVIIEWGAAAGNGCPITAYRVQAGAYGSPGINVGFGPNVFSHSIPWDPCASFQFQVTARNEFGWGPPSVLATDILDPLPPPCKGTGGDNGDADRDGVPDTMDACPFEPGSLENGCPTEEERQERLEAEALLRALDCGADLQKPVAVQAEEVETFVRIRWDYEGTCTPVRFLVWNGTSGHLIAEVPYGQPRVSIDIEPWSGPHRYWVQAEPMGATRIFDEGRSTPSNPVGRLVAAAAPPEFQAGDNPEPAAVAAKGGAWVAVGGGALLLAALLAVLVFVLRRNRNK